MQTKTYLATSVPAALEVARKELGSDALFVNSRPAPPEVREFGPFEVTFAFDPKPEAGSARPLPAFFPAQATAAGPLPTAANSGAAGRFARSEIDELRQQIAALRAEVGHSLQGAAAPSGFTAYLQAAGTALDEQALLAGRLAANGLTEGLAREIATAAMQHPGDRQTSLVREVLARIPVSPFVEMKAGESRSLAFIGPAGRGKTTSLIKVAVRYGLARRVPVRIYSGGAHGVGAQEQMARYAALLGVPFQACESLESLHLALQGDGWTGLVLIDTPGISQAETAERNAFSTFFGRLPRIEKHIVLRADARTADMLQMISCFSEPGTSRLLFTGLDEVAGRSAIVETLIRSGIPAVFTGTGQRIPDDLESLDAPGLASEVCRAGSLAAGVAA